MRGWPLASAVEWAVYGMVTVYRYGLRAFRVRRVGKYSLVWLWEGEVAFQGRKKAVLGG
jgi:hypothetical protein